jgi:MFS family permease
VSAFGFSALLMIWSLSAMIVEIPSGALADRFSRKWLLVLGAAFKASAFLTWLLWQQFFGYALGFVLWGAGSALTSGAWEALLYDLLKQWGRETEYARIYGLSVGLGTAAMAVGMLLGGATIVFGYDWVLLISIAVPLLAVLPMAIWGLDADRTRPARTPRYMTLLQSGVREALTNQVILYILFIGAGLLTVAGALDEFVSPLLREKGYPLQWLGYLGAVIFLCQALGNVVAHRVTTDRFSSLICATGLAGLALVGAAFSPGFLVVPFLGFFFFAFAFCDTLLASRLQSAIEQDARATVTSVVSFCREIGHIVFNLAFGWLALDHGFSGSTLAAGCLTVGLSAVFLMQARRWHVSDIRRARQFS